MRPARIAELLQPFLCPAPSTCDFEQGQRPGEACPERSRREPAVLSPSQLQHISTYIDTLQHWNARINLTAIRNDEEIVTRHFGESLFAARHLFPCDSPVPSVVKDVDVDVDVADLGSGSGFPGIPIKLWAPHIALTLIESNHKKAAFLREVVRALTLTNINIQNTRAENIPQTFDVVTMRAVERFTNILPIAARLLAPSARLALLISSSQIDPAQTTLPHLTWHRPILVPKSKSRLLLIGHRGNHHSQ
jgi:16S rRNA (guanine527-N7)-methyltransferase